MFKNCYWYPTICYFSASLNSKWRHSTLWSEIGSLALCRIYKTVNCVVNHAISLYLLINGYIDILKISRLFWRQNLPFVFSLNDFIENKNWAVRSYITIIVFIIRYMFGYIYVYGFMSCDIDLRHKKWYWPCKFGWYHFLCIWSMHVSLDMSIEPLMDLQ